MLKTYYPGRRQPRAAREGHVPAAGQRVVDVTCCINKANT